MKKFRIITICLTIGILTFGSSLFAQSDDYISIYAEGGVALLVIDGNNRRLGYDPITDTYYNQIPFSSIGSSDLDYFDDNGASLEVQNSPVDGIIGDLIEGEYQLIITGTKPSHYSINLKYDSFSSFLIKGGFIDSLETNNFTITFSRSPNLIFSVEKNINSSTIVQDLEVGYKLGLLGNSTFYDKLSNALSYYSQSISNSDSITAYL